MIPPSAPAAKGEIVIASWNVEALFDTKKDPGKDDWDWTPSGWWAWDDKKLSTKLQNLEKVLRTINGGKGPDILALNEVENLGSNGATVGVENQSGTFGQQILFNMAGILPSTSRTLTPM